MNTRSQTQNYIESSSQAFHGDGLLDIFLGAGVLITTAAMIARMPWMAGIFPATFIPLWRDARKKMTGPRLVSYAIPTGSAQRAMALVVGVTLAGVIGLVLGLVVFLLTVRGGLPAWSGYWWRLVPAGLIGGLILMLLGVTGVILVRARRYLGYAGLSAVILVLTLVLDLSLLIPMFALGGILMAGGLIKLVLFLREYPL